MDATVQAQIVGGIVGLATWGLQAVVTKWPKFKWLNPSTPNVAKLLTALVTTAFAAAIVGKWQAGDTAAVWQAIVAALGLNQGIVSILRGLKSSPSNDMQASIGD